VDGVVAYASDPAAPTAAYVAEKMGLPTNPFKSVEILARKDLFRQFLKEKGFSCPLSDNFYDIGQTKVAIDRFTFPVMIKPVDLSGSKGVKCIESTDELEEVFNAAMSISKTKNIIIEEFIEQDYKYLIGGDCFVLNGKVEFWVCIQLIKLSVLPTSINSSLCWRDLIRAMAWIFKNKCFACLLLTCEGIL
jgi:glutathione synthase/RimK-type ligase-like ATP-grasp enzyme